MPSAKVRFALDRTRDIGRVKAAIDLAREHGLKDFGIYVLIGFGDSPDDAVHRLETVRSWGIRPNPMRYQPLDELTKHSFVDQGWTEGDFQKIMQYFPKLRWLEHIPFEEFRRNAGPDETPLFEGGRV